MAIAHDSEILGAANTGAAGTNYDTSITPTNTPRGVCVIIVQSGTSDGITSVTYGITGGSVQLTRAATPYGFATDPTEPGAVYIYWAGDSATFPSGTQTVRVVKSAANNMRAAVSTMTCAVGQVVALDNGGTGVNAASANPSWTHSSLVDNVVAYLGLYSGVNALTLAPATNWTGAPSPGFEDMGNFGRGWARRTLATAGSLAPGWTIASDDWVGSSISFKEAPLGAPAGQPGLLHRSPRPSEQFHLYGPFADQRPATLLGG